MKRTLFLTIGSLCMISATAMCNISCGDSMKKIKTLPYPDTRMDEVTDDYHGTSVADPYRWLEDDNSEETAAWVKAQNEVTFDYLAQIPYREKILKRLTELSDYPKEGMPSKHGEWYYSFRNDGLQNQSVLYRQKSFDSEREVFLDPNKLSKDGTVALSAMSFSEDGKYFAYAVSAAGSDWVEIRLMDTETKETKPDHIKWVKFSGANWAADSKGFYYSRYDEPTKGTELSGQNRFQKVYYHKLGDPQSKDRLIYQNLDRPLSYYHGHESEDGKYIFINGSEGTSGSEILYREAKSNAPFKTLLRGFKYDHSVVYCKNDIVYIYTNKNAPNFRLVKINLKNITPEPMKIEPTEEVEFPDPVLTDVIPQADNRLNGTSFVGGYIVASYLKDASTAVVQFDMEGKKVRDIELPGIGTAGGFGGEDDDTETYYSLTSFTSPATIYRYTLADGKSEVLIEPQLKFDPTLYTTEQVFFTSKDGTQVPMFIVHRKDMKRNGQNPLHIYGYGGFDISLTPGFNPNTVMFLEQGGIYVSVSLRGGGEYGEQWHKSGMLDRKQNVFDDFIAAAEYLIKENYTSREKLAMSGGSNGGLLVGACMTQRPDLYAVAFPSVGVLDMLRFHKFTVGWGWVVEYGSADNAEQFPFLYKYSPLHNLRQGECYPATMVMTADHDDRVVPAHSFKFAAALQKAQGCDNPTLIRIDTNAGHGAGKPTSKRLEESADMYSFLFWNTGSKVELE